MNPPLDFRSANSLWGSVLAETLTRCGVTHAVISPGSRSTPLTLALAGHPRIEAVPVLDERSAAFFALGLAKKQGRPVVVLCTSGTAGANFLPAVIEAQEAGVPLIVITADRPPEMRDCASGQTIDQQKLFGGHVNFHHELAVPEVGIGHLAYLRQTLVHAVARAMGSPAGPVHLNAPFRDPLVPVDGEGATQCEDACDWARFFSEVSPPVAGETWSAVPAVPVAVHGLIVVGPMQTADPAENAGLVGTIAAKLGWPVLADGLSPLRNHRADHVNLVSTYDLLLRNSALAERLRPERVICLGGWPISKVLRAWLTAADAPTLMVSEGAANRDSLHGRTQHLRCSLQVLAEQLPAAGDVNGYARMWPALEQRARGALDARLREKTELFEGRAVWLLAQHLPEATPVFVANSMPVRDVEYFWPPNDRRAALFFNRGANGIDGTLSTALGVAHGGRPAVLVTGDLALLHDANGFLIRPRFKGSLTIVLINNQGGGIFEHLPIAKIDPPFEDFFATPQSADFALLAEAYGAEYVAVRDWVEFTALISNLPSTGVRVLEIRTDRKRDAATRKAMFAEIAAAL
ncbi:MAG: 2-succinyl-6-hydroxy-2,4-cyclohexadiene-carboxylic acid synthase/2-oxoglutarate decarboxylase [Verrucomicrobia bacterium]|nr:2-succinyl-6-hydroxy-2,4-cyclohexadiene-carboxylic acid synthase/2-oxoglutarate decarboxylase [Verrucomicrobiota bacterium]